MYNMNGRRLRNILALALVACMTVSPLYSSSGESASGGDLTAGDADVIVRTAPDGNSCSAQIGFAVKLFKENCAASEGSVCIAPMSLYSALAMTQNGAAGSTLEEMNALLGGNAEKINGYMSWYAQSLENDSQLRGANSLWMTDDAKLFAPDEKFVGVIREQYASDVYLRPFPPADCSETVRDINDWTSGATDGMIGELISSIPDDAIMYLINAAAFDAKWEKQYTADEVYPGIFTTAGGVEQECDMMRSTESIYIHDDTAQGFIKPYEGGRYSFAAILPNVDMTLDEYIKALTAKSFAELLVSAEDSRVSAVMPKFSAKYELEQSDALKALGMTDAFSDTDADFTEMGTCPPDYVIFINRVLHKTYIAVDEEGTKAAASSAVEMSARMTAVMDDHFVCLDRPFMYAIIDTQTGTPVFMGTVGSIE